ncbi:MAG: Phage portal protein lambda family, partial [Pseudomonadota bacterium]
MIAGSSDPLFDDWDAWMRDPAQEWSAAWTLVASRAKSLAEDSPECAAMIRSKLLRIHGPNGLKFRSLYQSDTSAETSQAEVETRRQIERSISLGSMFIDAGGVISRAEFDWQMSWNACVLGDAFAVRVWQDVDGIPTSTRWRIIHPARVCAPSDKATDPRYQGGIEVDGNGRPVALWVNGPSVTAAGLYVTPKAERIA